MKYVSTSINKILLILISLFLAIFLIKQFTKDNYQNQSYKFLMDHMNEIVKTNGVKKVSEIITNSYNNKNIDINQCHSLFHYLGHKAYEINRDNWDILASIDTGICMFGYEHGIEAQIALTDIFDENLMYKHLHQYCQKLNLKFGGIDCYHGLGHALIQQKIPITQALKICDRVVFDTKEDPSECYRGAFSEYVNVLKGIDGDTDAPIPGAVPVQIPMPKTYDFCLNLDKKYQEACVTQFTSFIYSGDLNSSLFSCNQFNSWVGGVCAYKVTQVYVSTDSSRFVIPAYTDIFIDLNSYVRRGYVKGVVMNYGQYHDQDLFRQISRWCKKLPLANDVNYYQGQL